MSATLFFSRSLCRPIHKPSLLKETNTIHYLHKLRYTNIFREQLSGSLLQNTRKRQGSGVQETGQGSARGISRQSGPRRAADLGRHHHQHPGQVSEHLLGRRHRKSGSRPAAGCGENRRQCAERFLTDIARQPVLQGAALRLFRRP